MIVGKKNCNLPSDSVVCDDQRFVVGVVEYPVTRGADVVFRSGRRVAFPQRAVSW